jgi:hypothetical protein
VALLKKKKPASNDYFGITEVTKHLDCDNFVISFPKSGRSWARFALMRYLANCQGTAFDPKKDVNDYAEGLPQLAFGHDGTSHIPINFTAEEWPADQSVYANKRVLFMVRDMRDTMVSYFYHCTEREKAFTGDMSAFLRDPRFGIAKPVRFLNRWVEARHKVRDFMVSRYEDMQANPAGEILRMALFLGYPVNNQAAVEAAKFSSFENMKEMERSGALTVKGRFGAGEAGTENSFKVRKGAAGGWVNEMSEADARFLTDYLNDNLSPFYGYRFA